MLFCSKPKIFELMTFADASEKAYGCVVYLRVTDEFSNIELHYVMGKTRVASRKT